MRQAIDLVGILAREGLEPRRAFLDGRGYVVPQDVKDVAMNVLRHRVIVTYEAEAEELEVGQRQQLDLVLDVAAGAVAEAALLGAGNTRRSEA